MYGAKGTTTTNQSVFLVDNTAGGELARRLQEAEKEAGVVTGYRVRITEAAGAPLGLLLPSTNPWGPQDCNRLDCITCSQGDEKRIDCRKRNILYESECTICNVGKKDEKEDLKGGKGVYEIVPEVRKVASILPKTSRKVKTGKLSKKEQRNMKMIRKLGFCWPHQNQWRSRGMKMSWPRKWRKWRW